MIDDKKQPKHIIKDPDARTFQEKYYQNDDVQLAKTFKEGIRELQKLEQKWETLLLDHDLGGIMTGYDVILWLEANKKSMPENIILITNNPVGRKRMFDVLLKWEAEGIIEFCNWVR